MSIEHDIIRTVIAIILLVGFGRLLGIVCSKFNFPQIVGYVVIGIIFSPFAIGSHLTLFEEPLVKLDNWLIGFSQISAIIILFSSGLHFTINDLKKVSLKAGIISGIEFLLSISIAYHVGIFFGFSWMEAAIIATTFGATSVAISSTVLQEIRKENTKEAKLLVNVAILDDILGLSVLSAVIALISTNTAIDIVSILFSTTKDLVFWILLMLGSVLILPKLLLLVKHRGGRHTTDVTAIGSAFGFASIAELLGLNPILGAFAAGMGLASSHIGRHVREYVETLRYVAAPLFFAVIGAQVDITKIWNLNFIVFFILLLVAVSTKVLGAGGPASLLLKSRNKGFQVGFGMIARSEVAFVTAGVGITNGIIDNDLYSILTLVVLSTVIISPVLLRKTYLKKDDKN